MGVGPRGVEAMIGSRVPYLSLSDPLARLNFANLLISVTIYSPILVLFFTGRGLDLFQVLSLEAFNGFAMVFLEVPTGVIADRIGLKRSVAIGFGLQVVWLVIVMMSHAYWLFLLSYAVLGLAITFRSGAAEAWIYETLKERGQLGQMSRSQGAFWASSLIGRILSALLAVLIVRRMTEGYFVLAIVLSAAVMCVGTLMVLTIPNRQSEHDLAERTGSVRMALSGFSLIRRNAKLRRIVSLSVLSDPLPYAILFLYQPYFQQSGTPTALYGLAAAGGAGLGALASRSSHRLEARLGLRRTFLLGNALPVAGYLAMALVFQAYAAALLFVVSFGAMQIRYPLIATMRNTHIASFNRATAISVIAMAEEAYAMVMYLLSGFLANIDLRLAFLVLGVVPLLTVVLLPLRNEHLIPVTDSPV